MLWSSISWHKYNYSLLFLFLAPLGICYLASSFLLFEILHQIVSLLALENRNLHKYLGTQFDYHDFMENISVVVKYFSSHLERSLHSCYESSIHFKRSNYLKNIENNFIEKFDIVHEKSSW